MAAHISEGPKIMGRGKATPASEKDPFAVALGQRIRAARERLNWTQRKLSREARYDAIQLSRVETGEAIPKADALLKLATALGEPIEVLYGITPPATGGSAATPPSKPPWRNPWAAIGALQKAVAALQEAARAKPDHAPAEFPPKRPPGRSRTA